MDKLFDIINKLNKEREEEINKRRKILELVNEIINNTSLNIRLKENKAGKYSVCEIIYNGKLRNFIISIYMNGFEAYCEVNHVRYGSKSVEFKNINKLSEYIKNVLSEEEQTQCRLFDKYKELLNKEIRFVTNRYIVDKDIRFKYFKDIHNVSDDFISNELINLISKFKNNNKIVFMFNSDNYFINFDSIINKMEYLGFKNVKKLENQFCKLKRKR